MTMNGSPTIVEPTTSSDSPLPSIPSLSPHPSSSSDSFDSSRPNSQGSSATSRSVSPSPIPKSVPAIDSPESFELPTLPSNPPLPENTSASQLHRQSDSPRSVPPTPAVSLRTNHEASWLSRLGSLISKRNWVGNALGTIGLGLTVIGMIIFGERTYKLAVWSAWNDALDTCGQLNSTGVILGSNCKKLLSNNTADVTLPPYSHWKRTWNATLQAGSRLLKDGFTKRSTLPNGGLGDQAANLSFSNFSSVAIVLASTVIMGGLSLIIFRRYWRTEEVFTSPVRSDWQFTRHHQEGPETVSGEGYRIIRRNPEDDHPLGQLRQRIRSSQPNAVENPTGEPTWQSHNTSEDTLVGPWKNTKWGTSKVSLTHNASDEKHENLIELETEGPNKTFFDPKTGEFIHLTPWKSTGDEEVHGLRPDGKGSTKRALAQMTLGGTGWAGGKNIDDQLAEELQANSKVAEKKQSKPQKAGDCVTGDMANEIPSGKPTMDPIPAANEEDTDEVDPKVTAFLLRKPWYASTKHDIDADVDVDADLTNEPSTPSILVSDIDEEYEYASHSSSDGQDSPVVSIGPRRSTWTVDRPVSDNADITWEPSPNSPNRKREAMDSFQSPYADREDIPSHLADFVIRELAHIDKNGYYLKSQVGSSKERFRTESSIEQQWQEILAEAEKKKVERKKAAGLDSEQSTKYLDDESFISNIVAEAENAEATYAELQKHMLGDHVGTEARVEAKRDRWQRFRSIGKVFGRVGSKSVDNSLKDRLEDTPKEAKEGRALKAREVAAYV